MKVTLAFSPGPRDVREWAVEVPSGASAGQAVAASGLLQDFPELVGRDLAMGVWGKRVAPEQALQEMDRLEIYRALRVDPKVARRERFNRQGVKRAGLFAKSRSGAKAGY